MSADFHDTLSGRVAIVTGGAASLGKATSLGLARRGASVVIGDRDIAGAQKVQEAITEFGGKALAVEVDVLDNSALEALLARSAPHLA